MKAMSLLDRLCVAPFSTYFLQSVTHEKSFEYLISNILTMGF